MEQVWEIPRFAMLMLSFSKRLDVGSEERWRERTPGFDAWEYLKYLLRLRSALLQSQIARHFEVGWIYSCVVFLAASLSESSFDSESCMYILYRVGHAIAQYLFISYLLISPCACKNRNISWFFLGACNTRKYHAWFHNLRGKKYGIPSVVFQLCFGCK